MMVVVGLECKTPVARMLFSVEIAFHAPIDPSDKERINRNINFRYVFVCIKERIRDW